MLKKTALLLCMLHFFWIPQVYTQDSCKVLKAEIAKTYVGKCKKGLANGKGIAKGIDQYEGHFKNGLPDGYGTYTWENGNKYEGYWLKGEMHGEGTMLKKSNVHDSTIQGIWKKGVFVKKIVPHSYLILKSRSVARYTVQKIKEGNRVQFAFIRNGTTNNLITNLMFAPSNGTQIMVGNKTSFDDIAFPFMCKINYNTPNPLQTAVYEVVFEIQINEPGEWLVTLFN